MHGLLSTVTGELVEVAVWDVAAREWDSINDINPILVSMMLIRVFKAAAMVSFLNVIPCNCNVAHVFICVMFHGGLQSFFD